MTTIYREADANLSALASRRVAIIGYGNQGRAQALNLRDSGVPVIIGNIGDTYRDQALAEGFTVLPIGEAVATADVILLLLPDEVLTELFPRAIAPHLSAGKMVSFASGYNVAYQLVVPPTDVDVVLLAPRMVGRGVRELYQRRAGFFSFVAIHQNATGQAREILLALCLAVGTLWKGALEVTFIMEAELDLFNEQGFGPAFGRVLLSAINTLVEAGYPREVVLLEFYMSGEFAYICEQMASVGLIKQLDHHSQTSQYGAISRGLHFLGVNVVRPMRRILDAIRGGKFAREWKWEQRTGKLRYRFLKTMALRQPINRWEQEARAKLGLDDPQ